MENSIIINFNKGTMKKLLVTKSFSIVSVLLAFTILSNLLLIWYIRVYFSDSYEISPYALLCVSIVYLSIRTSLTKYFFSSEEQKQKRLLTCALIIKIFILCYYFNLVY